MVAIKSTSESAAKWSRRAGNAGPEYEAGVKSPKKDWAAETKAAEDSYEKGVQAAISRKSFGKGVDKKGTAGWQKNAIEKGPSRFQEGVRLAQSDYEKGFAPFRDVIQNLTLPKRGPKGDPANINRVAVISKALHETKIQRAG